MNIMYRPMNEGEVFHVCKLIDVVFDEYEAPDYSQEGIEEFRTYNRPEKMLKRLSCDHMSLIALHENEIIGVIEMRENRHIALFFVSSSFQGKGVGRQLWLRALEACQKADDSVTQFTVNSSPYAEKIYRGLGFIKTKPEQIINGIKFIPMTKYVVGNL